MRKPAMLAPLMVAACSTVPTDGAGPPLSGSCRNEGLSAYVGQNATPETGGEIMRKSGARVLRWVPKGAIITMEFSADRVTIYLDANNKIERVNCG